MLVHVFEVLLFLHGGEPFPDGYIQGAAHLLHHFQGKLAPLPGFLNLLVGKLLRRNFHQVVISQMPALHQFIQRLFSVVASGCCGFLVHTPFFVPYFREIGNT